MPFPLQTPQVPGAGRGAALMSPTGFDPNAVTQTLQTNVGLANQNAEIAGRGAGTRINAATEQRGQDIAAQTAMAGQVMQATTAQQGMAMEKEIADAKLGFEEKKLGVLQETAGKEMEFEKNKISLQTTLGMMKEMQTPVMDAYDVLETAKVGSPEWVAAKTLVDQYNGYTKLAKDDLGFAKVAEAMALQAGMVELGANVRRGRRGATAGFVQDIVDRDAQADLMQKASDALIKTLTEDEVQGALAGLPKDASGALDTLALADDPDRVTRALQESLGASFITPHNRPFVEAAFRGDAAGMKKAFDALGPQAGMQSYVLMTDLAARMTDPAANLIGPNAGFPAEVRRFVKGNWMATSRGLIDLQNHPYVAGFRSARVWSQKFKENPELMERPELWKSEVRALTPESVARGIQGQPTTMGPLQEPEGTGAPPWSPEAIKSQERIATQAAAQAVTTDETVARKEMLIRTIRERARQNAAASQPSTGFTTPARPVAAPEPYGPPAPESLGTPPAVNPAIRPGAQALRGGVQAAGDLASRIGRAILESITVENAGDLLGELAMPLAVGGSVAATGGGAIPGLIAGELLSPTVDIATEAVTNEPATPLNQALAEKIKRGLRATQSDVGLLQRLEALLMREPSKRKSAKPSQDRWLDLAEMAERK